MNFFTAILCLAAVVMTEEDTFTKRMHHSVISNCASLVRVAMDGGARGIFDLTATVAIRESGDSTKCGLTIYDDSGALQLEHNKKNPQPFLPGDIVRVKGTLRRNEFDEPLYIINAIVKTGRRKPPEPKNITIAQINSGRFDEHLVTVEGVVRNIIHDDIDPQYEFIILSAGKSIVYIARNIENTEKIDQSEMIGAHIYATGACRRNRLSQKRTTGRHIERQISLIPGGIKILRPPTTDFSRLSDISEIYHCQPEEIPIDTRYRASGKILAVWGKDEAMLKRASGKPVRIRFVSKELPKPGQSVDVAGFAESNLFSLSLDNAVWKPSESDFQTEQALTNMTVGAIMEDEYDHPKIRIDFNGVLIRIEGTLHSTRGDGLDTRTVLSADGYFIPVEHGPADETLMKLPAGSRISVVGICIMDIDNWRPGAPFPRVRGFSVALRSPDDVKLIASPPWWTPRRLTVLLVSLFAILVSSILLNIILRHIIMRRGCQIAEEMSARVASESKVRERTRLAMELHDAISQNLTGVAYQLQTLRNGTDLGETSLHRLEIAQRTLGSCRDELRNCLWDLRNNALECNDMNEAIRRTLAPHVGNARLSVHFQISRARFTDNFSHALLHIIRELATNAFRHGKATHIQVAGCVDEDLLRFSVADNGCGFDPAACPGLEDGHFGLLGVKERVQGFEGKLSIESSPAGTKIKVSLSIPRETTFGNNK